MDNSQIIGTYETILDITGQMLRAAQDSDWDLLVSLEEDCRISVEKLMAGNPAQPLPARLQQRKVEIIRQVLADDAEIRNITEPWMLQLQNILGNTNRERRLNQAYRLSGDG